MMGFAIISQHAFSFNVKESEKGDGLAIDKLASYHLFIRYSMMLNCVVIDLQGRISYFDYCFW